MPSASTNRAIADRLDQIALMLELLGANPFRTRATARAARVVRDHPSDLALLAQDRSALIAIEGIGGKIADKIIEFIETGEIAEAVKLRAQVPSGLLDVLAIQGLGPKTVRALWTIKGIESVDDLQRIIDDGSILDLPRMGAKTVANIASAIAFARTSSERLPLGIAMPIAETIIEHLRPIAGVEQIEIAGSLRRGRDTIGDIDLLVATTDAQAVSAAFIAIEPVVRILASGATKSSVRYRLPQRSGRFGMRDPDASVQVDLRVVAPEGRGAGLLYFSGSKDHGVRLRERALKLGLTLNEYGLFPEDEGNATPPQQRGVAPVAARTEADIYEALGLPLIPPEIREDRGELALTETPRLIEIGDIKAELHAHTTDSDGSMSLDELIAQARARGFHTIAVTDHSKSAVQANGLSPDRLRAQIERVRAANAQHEDIRVLAGSEVDILSDGSLDYDDELLAELDIVIASPHVALSQDPKAATRRLIRAIEHPLVNIIGHPTGRLIGRRPGLEPAMDELIAAAKEHNTALEINAHWMRLDLRDVHVRAVVQAGGLIAINCDDHGPGDFDNLRYGVLTARRGWLSPERCVNTWPRDRLDTWLTHSSI